MVAFSLVSGGVSYFMNSKSSKIIEEMNATDLKFQQNVQDAYVHFLTLDDNSIFLVGLGVGENRFGDQKLVDQTIQAYKDAEVAMNTALGNLNKITLTPAEREHVNKAIHDVNEYLKIIHKAQDNNTNHHEDAQRAVYEGEAVPFFAFEDDLKALRQDAEKRITEHTIQSVNLDHTQFLWVNIISILSALIGIAAIILVRVSTKPLQSIVDVVQKVSQGDLTVKPVKLKANDDIGQLGASVNTMIDSLRTVITSVEETSSQMAASAEQLTASAEQSSQAAEHTAVTMQELAEGTDKQVQSTDETDHIVRALAAGASQIAARSETVSQTAQRASRAAEEGNRSIHKTVEQMKSISQSVNGSSAIIENLETHAQNIGEIVSTIEGIAAQTNLLALNAAIEAARAGEHGRGFAVVSNEVRKLAEQSTQSAHEIGETIHTILAEIQDAVASMKLGTEEVSRGLEVVHDAGLSFDQIQNEIREVSRQIAEVTSSVQQMSAGAQQAASSVELIKEVTDTTASATQSVSASSEEQLASMEEITSSAIALTEMAEELDALIKKFKVRA
ncbi:hypothetical protein EL26_13720 [Tumebacillus flagellatus]|uniref:Chemotaxis protein n=2 Tax=Tumebacillus flagellatus TaxID=1157490 RepID=A0A074LKZ0_9BACL|nr:hypothetical protein EL26_13720 [Tumebacillus flagellatus]